MIITSKFMNINWMDIGKAALMAVLSALLYYIQDNIPGWNIDPQTKAIISASIAYLIKNFLTPSSVMIKPASDELVNQAEETKKNESN